MYIKKVLDINVQHIFSSHSILYLGDPWNVNEFAILLATLDPVCPILSISCPLSPALQAGGGGSTPSLLEFSEKTKYLREENQILQSC